MNNLQLTVLLNAIDKISAPVKNATKSVNALSEQLKQSKSALRDLEKVQNQMRAFSKTTENIKKSSEAIDKHAKKLDNLRNKIQQMKDKRINLKASIQEQERAYQRAIAQGNALGAANTNFKLVGMQKEYERLKASISSTNKLINKENANWKAGRREKAQQLLQLRDLKRKLKTIGVDTKNFAQHEGTLAEKIKVANAAIETQQKKLDKLNLKQAAQNKYRGQVEKLKEISGKAQMVGAQSMAAGATITAPIANATKDFMSFEDAMLGVARQVDGLKNKSTNELTPEFDEWKKKIQALSNELPLTTVEIANMIESAARMDVPKEQLEEFVRLNTQMATAFDAANPDELVEQYGKVTKNFKLSAVASRELADAINYLDDNAISKGTEIIGFMNRVSGISGIAKISEKNMAALGSTLQTAGAAEEQSATAVNTIFTRLSSASKKKPVRNALKAMGLDASKVELGMAKDAQGTLMQIVETVKKMPEHKRLGFIADLVGTEHTKTLALLVSKTEEWRRQIELANSEAAKGSMGREFDTRMKALSASTQIFNNQLFNLKATIGGALAPTLHKVMVKLGGIVDKANAWIQANPELASKIILVASAIGTTLTAFGALSLALSFVLYPMARVALGFGRLTGINTLLASSFKKTSKEAIATSKNLFSIRGWKTILQSTTSSVGGLVGKMGKLSFWGNLVGKLLKGWLFPVRMLFVGLGSAISFLLSPIGAVVAAIVAAGIYIYNNWEKVKRFFGGFLAGLKEGLQPVIDKFKPFVGWVESAFKWFTSLLSPVQSTTSELLAASRAGRTFGEWIAFGIDLALKPLQLLIQSVQWLIENLPKINEQRQQAKALKDETIKAAFGDGIWGQTMSAMADIPEYAAGGYTGNGGKYQPMGIVHGGEYVMTKEATSRLGIHTLNALNYGKQALIAGGLGISVATAAPEVTTAATMPTPIVLPCSAPVPMSLPLQSLESLKAVLANPLSQALPNAANGADISGLNVMLGANMVTAAPVQVDTRAPLAARPIATQVSQPMNVQITINAAPGQDERTIARMVAQEMQRIQNQQQARQRSSLRDRA